MILQLYFLISTVRKSTLVCVVDVKPQKVVLTFSYLKELPWFFNHTLNNLCLCLSTPAYKDEKSSQDDSTHKHTLIFDCLPPHHWFHQHLVLQLVYLQSCLVLLQLSACLCSLAAFGGCLCFLSDSSWCLFLDVVHFVMFSTLPLFILCASRWLLFIFYYWILHRLVFISVKFIF